MSLGADIGSTISDFGAAQGAKSQSYADLLSQKEYQQSALLAGENKNIEQTSIGVQQAQLQREQQLAIGNQRAQIAGAGFEAAGSASAILKSSTQQANLAHAMVTAQGQIQENVYTNQVQAYNAQAQEAGVAASAAQSAASNDQMAGYISAVSAVADVGAMVAM